MIPENFGGTQLEKGAASVLDVAIRTAAEFLTQKAGYGEMIEGENIEHLVRAAIQRALKT